MKLCTECDWYREVGCVQHQCCGRPELLSPVTGEADKLCVIERASSYGEDRCAPAGKYWKERVQPKASSKKSWWERLWS